MPVIIVVHTIVHKIHQVRYNCFRAFAFQKFNQMIVGQWHVFYQNLADNADAGPAPGFIDGEMVEIPHNSAADFGIRWLTVRQLSNTEFLPFFMQRISGTFL